MLGILYKEFTISKKLLLIMIPVVVIMAVLGVVLTLDKSDDFPLGRSIIPIIISFMMFMFFSVINTEFFRNDESKPWFGFAASTPQGLKKHLLGKFVFIMIINIGILAVCLIMALILKAITNGAVDAVTAVFMIFCAFTLLNAIELPFIIRFGAERGAGMKVAVFGVILFVVAVYALFGDLSFIFGEKTIMEIMAELGDAGKVLSVVFPIASVAAYAASYFISRALYLKGAENYEQ